MTSDATDTDAAKGARARFRDPAPRDAEDRALRLAIAEALVRAPTLPVALPAFQLSLVSVEADRRGIALVVGPDAPVADLYLRRAPRHEVVALGKAPSRGDVVTVEVRERHPSAERHARALAVMAERLRAATSAERWDAAWRHARLLAESPGDVSLEFHRQLVAGVARPQGLVRTGFRCNQDCGICWQDRDWGRHDEEQIVRWIEDLAAAGARSLIISGGEPTLDPALERYVRRAREVGFDEVTLETNAIQFSKPGYVETLGDAGLTSAFVSLHSGDAAVSDAITRAPGTHARTIAGIHALLASSVPVKLNAVMTQEGLDHLAELPDFLVREFGVDAARAMGLMLSYPAQPYDPALVAAITPEPRKLRRELSRTIERAFALGVVPTGLDGPCGPPLCAYGADSRVTKLDPVPERVDFRQQLAACEGCSVRHACFGVRFADVELYGDDCVAPLESAPNQR